jgi:hypothetical protein
MMLPSDTVPITGVVIKNTLCAQLEMYFTLKFSDGNFGRTVGWSPVGWPQFGVQLW